MRAHRAAVLALSALLTPALSAEVIVVPADSSAHAAPAGRNVAEKIDPPASQLLVPFYEVDTTSANGVTTLFAVRNIGVGEIQLHVQYFRSDGLLRAGAFPVLQPGETYGRNLRDIEGLVPDLDGIARGFVLVTAENPTDALFVGDYLQVDVGNNFATGERMNATFDLCNDAEIRALDFGSDTELRIFLDAPQGLDPADPVSFTVTPVAEDGTVLLGSSVKTDQFSVELLASEVTDLQFGTLVFDFSPSGGGTLYAEYSAEGKFSVGMNGACLDE